jgi:MFS family permease
LFNEVLVLTDRGQFGDSNVSSVSVGRNCFVDSLPMPFSVLRNHLTRAEIVRTQSHSFSIMSDATNSSDSRSWYEGITGYQWLVLTVCSAGWMFDIFEGQIFVASMRDAMPQLLGGVSADDPLVAKWNNWSFASFLIGGAVGGVYFGWLSDKWGRSKTMIVTILFYSVFTCITALAQEPWHMVVLRFLVAMGVGGEWAVASAMVSEVMPKRSRPVMSSIFHASSVGGTLLAAAVGFWILAAKPWGDTTWKLGFLIGVLPALLILVIRWRMHEPEQWKKAQERAKNDKSQATGQMSELFRGPNLRATMVGVTLATIGLITFWGCHIYGKNALMRHAQTVAYADIGKNALPLPTAEDASLVRERAVKLMGEAAVEKKEAAVTKMKQDEPDDYKTFMGESTNETYQIGRSVLGSYVKKSEMTSMTLNTIGGGLGLVLFGWISTRIGRRGAFVFYHAGAAVMVGILFLWLIPKGASYMALAIALPFFGFLTLGMHAGYAVYFPELYQTKLRGTGTGFCFNMGRVGSAIYLLAAANLAPMDAAVYMIPIYIFGCVVALMGRETRGADLPE